MIFRNMIYEDYRSTWLKLCEVLDVQEIQLERKISARLESVRKEKERMGRERKGKERIGRERKGKGRQGKEGFVRVAVISVYCIS